MSRRNLRQFLDARLVVGAMATDEVVAAVVPLMQQVIATHEAGWVAPLEGIEHLQVDAGRLGFDARHRRPPRTAESRLVELEASLQGPFEVVAEIRQDDVDGALQTVDLSLGRPGDTMTRPVYVPGYRAWEQRIGHHDGLADIYCLGLILASLACGLDFELAEDLARFVEGRPNLLAMTPELHPVIADTIVRMTELDRHRRAQNLQSIVRRLQSYRDVDVDPEFDVASITGFKEYDRSGRRRAVLSRFEERLYEISRRNALLHFKPRTHTLNLTLASVPVSWAPQRIRPQQLFTWHDRLKQQIVDGRTIVLNKSLRFDEAAYLPSVLDKIRLEAGRDIKEVGFSNLRLIVGFLRWHNLKDSPETPIHSPLVLLPVKLEKQRGVRDLFLLKPVSPDAEVNPVLRHRLQQLYGIRLPEFLDLTTTDLDDLHRFLQSRIAASEPSVRLQWIDRPRVVMMHRRARRRLDRFRRRQRRYGRTRSYQDLDYSYRREYFQPLGLRLFRTHIVPSEAHLDLAFGGGVEAMSPGKTPEVPADTPGTGRAEAAAGEQIAAFKTHGATHPYAWEIDLCNVTLGNFRYRKMSLVRDYETVIAEDRGNRVFDGLFSIDPRPTAETTAPLPLTERFPVLPCDPTQASAIDQARRGQSYIIQGPPGTGKSQTITNLIADFVARGRRVLFVCEKRAAIDVVYLRLKALGLDELSCLVHDAQADKKAVIGELRQTYRRFLEESAVDGKEKFVSRDAALDDLQGSLAPLEAFDRTMRDTDVAGVPTWRLLTRLIELRDVVPELATQEMERLHQYSAWTTHRDVLTRLGSAVAAAVPQGVFSQHPLASLNPALGREDRPQEFLAQRLRHGMKLYERLLPALQALPVDAEAWASWDDLGQLQDYAEQVQPFASRGLLALSDRESRLSRSLEAERRMLKTRRRALRDLQEANGSWITKLSRHEIGHAIEIAEALQGLWLPGLRPRWWKLRSLLRRSYDWKAHALRPSWLAVLTRLEAEYEAAEAVRELESQLCEDYDWDDFEAFCGVVEFYREATFSYGPRARALHQGALDATDSSGAQRALAALPRVAEDIEQLAQTAATLFADPSQLDLRRWPEVVREIERHCHRLDEIVPCWIELLECPEPLVRELRQRPWTLDQLEAAVAVSTLEAIYADQRQALRFSALHRDRCVDQLQRHVRSFYQANVRHIREAVRDAFRGRVALSETTHGKLSASDRALKERYSRGRRELEHEFGKKMRYKSIRDLWSGDAGEVLRDLKPVWLMSPLSISDTLPLTDEHFDVVIFDEASQVPVEEAVPTLFRGRQVIVVGDEMQLPPTSFFAARSADDELLQVEEEGDIVEFDLSANSFLNQAAKRLPSTYLGWHYRSRSEALISFSNAAFYRNRLLTVPEEELPRPRDEIVVQDARDDAEAGVEALLDRSVSFHLVDKGRYTDRCNLEEAEYIAHLVRGLLAQERRQSIGVVAFSEAQQKKIELALARLCRRDSLFAKRLEAEYERQDDGEHVGLLVKNLENIQGDERDIVILSVCYGPSPSGRMRMRFGPINQGGGEKRLNVAFSRSKHHMVVVSSMRYSAITNVYNDGARSLRSYLRYAEAVSKGDTETAEDVLSGLSRGGLVRRPDGGEHAVVEELRTELESRGFRVDLQVGHSIFRCDLAVVRPGDRIYRLGILVDTEEHYGETDLLERDLMKPKLLEAFGWRVTSVLTKDWYHDRDTVLNHVLQQLAAANARDGASGSS